MGGADNVDGERVPTASVQIFDPTRETWRKGPDLAMARMEPTVVQEAGRIYAIGGADADENPMASVESIAPGESSWRDEAPLPKPLRQFDGAALDGVIYCIAKDGAFSFEIASGTWSELPPLGNMPQAAHDGEIWVLGGVRIKRTFRYDPARGSWRPGPALPTEQSWGAASDLNGQLVVAGGAHRSEFHNRYIFDDSVYMYREGSFEE